MTRFIAILFFQILLLAPSITQTYYLRYDPGCLDRYEFVTDVDPNPLVVYTTKSYGSNMTQLDIGKEDTKWVTSLPSQLTPCNSLTFDKALSLAINNSTVKLYIVRQSPTHYLVSPVEKATFFTSHAQRMEATMEDADFMLNYDNLVSSKNLGTPASDKEIYLEGTIKLGCMNGYIFRKKIAYNAQDFKEYTIVPGVGIINKRMVPYDGAVTNSIRLNKVNEATWDQYLAEKCKGAVSAATTEYQESGLESAAVPDSYGDLTTAKGQTMPVSYSNQGPCPPPTKSGTHIVQKGETLYSLSKRYGVTVDQLKAWNKIGATNAISLCQELVVTNKPPTAVPPTTTTGTTANTGTTTGPTTTPKPGTSTTAGGQFHIVKPNETVAQLAAMYGYTETRFRQMNSLGTYERVYAGQKLFTSDCDCPNITGVATDAPMPYDTETERLTQSGSPDVYFRPIKVHEVKESETPFSIAKLYDTTVDRINELNGLDKNAKLSKGQRVYVQ